MTIRSVLICLLILAGPVRASADTAPNAVTDWATIVQTAIHNAGAPRAAGSAQILHTMIVLAMYDAVVAIEGGSKPYAVQIKAWPGADVRAAVATAAYETARARVAASQVAYLDQQYATYLAGLADGEGKTEGIRVGRKAAAAMIHLRADDGFNAVVLYECSAVPPPPGEFEPDSGCPTQPGHPQPADVKVGQIKPFSFKGTHKYRPDGPAPMTSKTYTRDFVETRDYGRADSGLRSPEQTDIAFFWAEHAYVHWNRNLVNLAIASGLSLRDTARFFALVHTTVSDAVIVGFEAKYQHAWWRPRTAIPRADTDGNLGTDADPTWTPLLLVNHPEYPSGHAFWSTALLEAVATFFGTREVTWTIVTSKVAVPRVEKTERTYTNLETLRREIMNARIWGGLHWRHSMRDGIRIGRQVADHVARHYFRPAK